MFHLPMIFVHITTSKRPNCLLSFSTKNGWLWVYVQWRSRSTMYPHKPSHLQISVSHPCPEGTHSTGRISEKVKSKVSFLLDIVHTVTLRCIYCQVLSLPPVKTHAASIFHENPAKLLHRKQASKIYLLCCPSAFPRPIPKLMSKVACCTSLFMVLLAVLCLTAALAMIKMHSTYKSTQQHQCIAYSFQHLSWRAPAHPLNNLHECYQYTVLGMQPAFHMQPDCK